MQIKRMRLFIAILFVVCVNQATAVRLSTSERKTGDSIAKKLGGFLRRCYMDLQLVLDSSGSIGTTSFKKGKDANKFIVSIVDQACRISRYGSRVGLIEFSESKKTHVEFKFGQLNSKRSVHRGIDRVGYDRGGATATAKALKMARSQFLQNSSRNKKVAWITTDGNSNQGGSPFSPALALRRMGVTVCTMAVGRKINMEEIRKISSPGCYFQLSSYSAYERVMKYALNIRLRQSRRRS